MLPYQFAPCVVYLAFIPPVYDKPAKVNNFLWPFDTTCENQYVCRNSLTGLLSSFSISNSSAADISQNTTPYMLTILCSQFTHISHSTKLRIQSAASTSCFFFTDGGQYIPAAIAASVAKMHSCYMVHSFGLKGSKLYLTSLISHTLLRYGFRCP